MAFYVIQGLSLQYNFVLYYSSDKKTLIVFYSINKPVIQWVLQRRIGGYNGNSWELISTSVFCLIFLFHLPVLLFLFSIRTFFVLLDYVFLYFFPRYFPCFSMGFRYFLFILLWRALSKFYYINFLSSFINHASGVLFLNFSVCTEVLRSNLCLRAEVLWTGVAWTQILSARDALVHKCCVRTSLTYKCIVCEHCLRMGDCVPTSVLCAGCLPANVLCPNFAYLWDCCVLTLLTYKYILCAKATDL